jgi:hypothetical protein
MDSRSAAEAVTDPVPGQPSVTDARRAAPSDVWCPSVRRNDRRVR